MNTSPTQDTQQDRLKGLDVSQQKTIVNKGYSRFVMIMRWGLPIFALIMMVVVIAWPELDEQIQAIPQDQILNAQEIAVGGNELLNPQYETTDSNNNPVNVTASKAIQSQNNKDVVRLEIPSARFKTQEGNPISVDAKQGTYDQASEKLFLQDNVKINHNAEYFLEAEELRLNMKTQEAFSNKNITITNKNATLRANGLQGNMVNGTLFFEGPATLTFNPSNQKEKIESNKGQ